LIDALMRDLGTDPYWLTPGLTPLSGDCPWWLRLTRGATVALYDFTGLQKFRARLGPSDWRPISLAWDRGTPLGPIIDVLRLFARGRILPFALRSLVRHPNGPPWAVAVPLVMWTVLLALLAAAGDRTTLGFSPTSLRAWVIFDAVLAWLLFRAARHPRRRTLAALAAVAAFDAVASLLHLAAVGVGQTPLAAVVRMVATLGPIIGTAALIWATWRAHVALKSKTA
jgi:hypothetical protein